MACIPVLFLLFVIISNYNARCVCPRSTLQPIVNTKYGQILGYRDSESINYLGIPYALPPINDLRWKKPVDPISWSPNLLNATRFKSACPQLPVDLANPFKREYFFKSVKII